MPRIWQQTGLQQGTQSLSLSTPQLNVFPSKKLTNVLVLLGLRSGVCCHCTFFIPTTSPTLSFFSLIVSLLVNMKCCFLAFVFAFLYYQITWNTLSLTLSCAYLLQRSIHLSTLHIFMQVILWSEGWFRKPNAYMVCIQQY